MGKKFFMGIDIGTYESKGMIIDGAGNAVATHSVPHEMESPQVGFAEHDADKTWWHDFCTLSNALLQSAGIDPKAVMGVGCSAIGPCCLPLDRDGRPLRKAILYGVDVRASKEIDDLNRELGEENILARYGNPITSQSIGPKILWIKNNEPEIYAQTARFVTSSTYLVEKLTGGSFIDRYTAAYFTPMYDLQANDWDVPNLGAFCRPEQLPQCRWTDEIVGRVTPGAARETGLAEGTPVTTGTADAAADAVGVGVSRPGDLLLMFGSSVYMIHVVSRLATAPQVWAGPYLFKDTYMVASGMSTTGTLTRWFRDNLAPETLVAERATGENAYERLMREAEDVPPGSDGLIVLPYFSGERTPINDPKARGVVFGLNLHHTRKHIYNACLEGVGYGIGQHFDIYAKMGLETRRTVAVGGGTKNRKWMQAVCDITAQELSMGGVFGAAFGDALLAALATGHFSSVEGLDAVLSFGERLKPNLERHRFYSKYKEIYTRLYLNTRDLMHSL